MPIAESDEDLVTRGRSGDLDARRALVERHVDSVFRLAYRFARTRVEAEDAAQDVLARMLEYSQGWLSTASFRVWIKRAVLNKVIDQYRRRRRWAIVRPLDEGMKVMDTTADAETALGETEAAATVARAVRGLPQRQQIAIVLCYYENLSLSEAAAVMKVSTGAIGQLLHRAKEALRSQLHSVAPEDMPS